LAPGEPLYTTDEKFLYIGTGDPNEPMVQVTGYGDENAVDAVGAALVAGQHENIEFIYGQTQDLANRIDAVLDLSVYSGDISADSFKGNLLAEDDTVVFNSQNKNLIVANLTASSLTLTSGDLVIDLKGSVFGDDSTLLVDGTNSRIVGPVFANVTGDVTGNLTGSVFGDDSTLLVDGTNNRIVGPVFANVTGNLTGSVFGDDSTLLVDGTNSRIVGPVFANVTGDVTGNLTGSVFANNSSIIIDANDSKVNAAGGLTTPLIESGTIGPIAVASVVSFQETVNATNSLVVNNSASVETDISNDIILSLSQSHNDVPVSQFVMNRSRGTTISPLTVDTNDQLGVIAWSGYTGDTYLSSSAILGSSTGTITPLKVPGKIEIFTTGDTNGLLVRNAQFSTSDGNFFNSPTTISTDEYDPASMIVFSQHHESANARNISYIRSRGTEATPAAVEYLDDIADLVFQGYSGTAYRAGMVLSVVVDDPVTSTNVPMALVLTTNTGSGFEERIIINSNGNLTSASGIFSRGTAGIGYSIGAGGTVSQLTDKSTGVTLDKITGEITLEDTTTIAAGSIVSFVLTNSTIATGDHVLVSHVAGGTLGEYNIVGVAGNGSATIYVKNLSSGSLSEGIVLKFTVIKSVTA
jgi:hypothetical protein